MNETLTAEKLDSILTDLAKRSPAPVVPTRLHVFHFEEQWRFPRSKKRRMRKKWRKNPANWRPKTNQLFRMELPAWAGGGCGFVMSPDMHARVRAQLAHASQFPTIHHHRRPSGSIER